MPEVAPLRSVAVLLRLSFIWYVDPDSVVPSVTVPTKMPRPVPCSMSSQDARVRPLVASTTVCWRLGVWSVRMPSVTTSYARTGLAPAA